MQHNKQDAPDEISGKHQRTCQCATTEMHHTIPGLTNEKRKKWFQGTNMMHVGLLKIIRRSDKSLAAESVDVSIEDLFIGSLSDASL